jgi:ATP-dependent Clp protease ATP-binding subunit ClpA
LRATAPDSARANGIARSTGKGAGSIGLRLLEVYDAALRELVREGFDPVYGERSLKRAIQQQIENPLAKEILSGHFAPKDVIRVDV